MTFHPEGTPIPAERRSERLVLRPLLASHVDLDYDAVMASAEQLRRWGQTEWPGDDFTREENLADLRRHQREHEERQAFTFTVLDPTESRCLGCIYLQPLRDEEAGWRGDARHVTRVAFWVRTAEIANELDRHLLEVTRDWLRSDWGWDRVIFSASALDERQARLFRDAGMVSLGEVQLADGRRVSGYLA